MYSKARDLWLIKQTEERRQISQREIARETGLTPNTVSRWMSDDPITRIEHGVIAPLCVYFGCQIGDIVYLDTEAGPIK